MKIKALTLVSAVAMIGALGAGLAVAQTAAKPQASAAPAATSGATATPPAHKPMHRDAAAKPDGAPRGPGHAPSFEDIDTNHDGTISKAEFEAFHAAHPIPPRGGPGEGMRGEGGRGGDGWRFMAMQEMMWAHMRDRHRGHGDEHGGHGHFDLKAADTDHDGKISWAEFQAAANTRLKERFDRLDRNHDGFISDDELHGPRDHGDWHGKDGRGEHGKGGKDGPPPAPPADGAAK